MQEGKQKNQLAIYSTCPPMQNTYPKRKNGSVRRELLNAYLFSSLAEVRAMSEKWRNDYNNERPHKSLGYLSPIKYSELKNGEVALSTPASETLNNIEAQPIVDKAVKQKINSLENSNYTRQ